MKTIAAISTAAAPGGIGIIRISGGEARAVGDRVFRAASGETLSAAAGYRTKAARGSTNASRRFSPRRRASPARTSWSFPATAACSF